MELFLDSEVQTFCRLADDIWEYAETAFEEIKSADALCSTLESFGFTIEKILPASRPHSAELTETANRSSDFSRNMMRCQT